jgi:simple sugar transport system ATP-binding protein
MEALKNVSEIGVNVKDATVRVSALSGGERQAVAIARATYFGAKLLLLDEPTANLSIKEAHKVLNIIEALKKIGISIIFITHNIYHVFEVADRFLILDKGKKIAEYYKKDVTAEDIIEIVRSGKPKD